MRVLIIDTSKPTVWVAVAHDEQVIAEEAWAGDKAVGSKLLVVTEKMIGEDRPDRIAVHRGPGHFMRLRTGVVTAQLLARAWGAELAAIEGNTPAEIVQQAFEQKPVQAITPAY